MADAEIKLEMPASLELGDAGLQVAGDPHAALIMAAKAEVELMMKNIAAQSQAPALFSTTLSEACVGQHLGDFVKILVEMGGIGPALSEMQSAQNFNNYAANLDIQSMQGMQSMQGLNHMAPFDIHSMQGFNHLASQFAFPFMSSGCQTPRSREQLSTVAPVELELVGTTLVAKTANEYVKLDVRILKRTGCKHRLS
jgi:hypothetical protein